MPTGKYTAIDIFSVIKIPVDELFTLQSFVILGRVFSLKPGKFSGEVRFIDPEGKILQTSVLEGDIKYGDLGFSAQFNSVKIEKLGKHLCKLYIDGKEVTDDNRFFVDVIKATK